MTKYESILNALSASKNTFSEEDLLNLYELLLHAYAKGTPARGTIWNVILRDPRLSQFKEKLVKQFLWEYKELLERFLRAYNTPRSERSELVERFLREYNELSSLSRDVDRFSNDPSMLHLMVNLCEGKYNGEWEFRKADTDGANPSAPHAHAKNAAKKYADAKLNPYTGEICDSKGHSTGKFIYFDDYKKKYGGKEDFADFVTESVNCTHDHPVYTNVDEIIKSVKAAIKQGRILTPAEWKQVRKIYR